MDTTTMIESSDLQLSMESMIVHIDASNKHPVQFTSEDLRLHLEPIIEKMIASEDSYQFQQPVDPVALNIPDYRTIIKHPMDLSTMHKKLLCEEYKNPLEFCDDAWLMFNNAWIYNKRITRIYKSCRKLAQLFVESIDPVVQKLGYCCARQYSYFPHVLLCYGNELSCQITYDGDYYYYNNSEPSRINLSNEKYTFCVKCFNSIKSDAICIGDDPTQTLVEISKSLFVLAKNNIEELETMIDCIVCTRRWHKICALHFDEICPEGFICNTCIHQYNIKRKENCYRAQTLPTTDLSLQLEKRVNDFLHNESCQTGHVTIRILTSNKKICQVKSKLKNYYSNQIINDYPYETKGIFAFQEIEGVDVIFFGMYVQEYDEHCPTPNTRRVYISYFDTVHFFQPKIYQTNIYHEILIGYLDYAKQHGYIDAHIWAFPASQGIDYIFCRHPPEQHMITTKRMHDWCKTMLDKAIVERIVINYKDIMQYCLDNQVLTVLDIPYFDDDFWPIMIEENIEKLNQKEEEEDSIEPEDPIEISGKRKSANTYEKKRAHQRKLTKDQMSNSTDLLSVTFSTMEKYKETFFVIRLNNEITSDSRVDDTNALIQCDLMDTREAFVNFAANNNYEFSSLRRAKFSTMALLYELHTLTTDKYYCNRCRQQCDIICYYCIVCVDFDLCEKCYNIEPKHEHKMERRISSSIADVNQDDTSMARIQLQRLTINATFH